VTESSEYVWKVGDWAHVVGGPHCGAQGRIDFIDWTGPSGARALVDFGGGRKGGLTWVPLTDSRAY